MGIYGFCEGMTEFTDFLVMQWLNTEFTYRFALWASVGVVGFGALCGIGWIILDKLSQGAFDESGDDSETEIDLGAFRHFSISYWLIVVNYTIFFASIFCFSSLSEKFFFENFDIEGTELGFYAGYPWLIVGILSPFLGIFFDKYGQRCLFAIIAILINTGSFLVMLYLKTIPLLIPLSGLGLSYGITFIILPAMVPMTVLSNRGTAFGIARSMHSLGLAILVQLVGYIADNYGFRISLLFLVGVNCLSLIASVLNQCVYGHILNLDEKRFQKRIKYYRILKDTIQDE
eukprot:TRINITY_DN2884_c0_g1_i1.p1 TRINITY_DN2884_c0_g1~~TRINITY_DN2884_c0_g1_i1.p1  ORF type:complete len:288 (-),score=50.43 TRINITY_DN2884_c0_g1_i1:20-883(-)